MNPFNRGCALNIKGIFPSRIPKSRNNFRAMVRNDSAAFTASVSLNSVKSPDLSKTILDLEMGGKRHAVAEAAFEDLQTRLRVSGVRFGAIRHPTSTFELGQSQELEATTDLETLFAEFGMEHRFTDRAEIPGKLLK